MRGARDHFVRRYEPSAFEAEGEAYRVVDAVDLLFDVHKDQRQFGLVGRVRTTLELTCGRCLERFTLALDEPFDVLYLPHHENTGDGEVEVEDDDLSTAYYRDEVIDLGQLVREQFCLALPMKPLCAEGCQGLCSVCGTNLNVGTCSCARQVADPRWDALRSLADRKSN
jgi:uncharacterized protein